MPARDVQIDDRLVLALLADQHPDLADLPLAPAAEGWDNVVYRLGADLAVRLPRRVQAAEAEANQLDWLPRIVARGEMPLPVSAPVRQGAPAHGYPYRWSVVPWFPGSTADVDPPNSANAAASLGAFVAAFCGTAPSGAPRNPVRGVPLVDRDERTRAFIAALPDGQRERAAALWEGALSVPEHAGPACWIHGDLHPGNLIVRDGAVAAVIDFTDLCAGDPATDLAIGWMLLEPEHHEAFRRAAGAVGADDAAWERARGWAVGLGAATFVNSADNPRMRTMGEATLRRALA